MAGFDGYQLPVELASLAREFSLGGLVFWSVPQGDRVDIQGFLQIG